MAVRKIEIIVGGKDFSGAMFRSVDGRLTKFVTRTKAVKAATMGMHKAFMYAGGFYAMYRGLRFVVGAAVEFETQMANVSTMLDDKMMPRLHAMGDELRDIGIATGDSTASTSKGLYDILSAGIDARKSLMVLRASSRAAVGGMTDTGTATKGTVALLKSYNLEALQAYRVNDLMFASVRRGVMTYEDLAQNIGNVAATANAAGMPIENLLATVAEMTRAGLAPDKAVTALKSALSVFLKPAAESVIVARRFGVELNTSTLKAIGLIGALRQMKEAGATAEDFAAVFPNRRAIAAIMALQNNLEGYQEGLDFVTESAHGAEKAHQKLANTTASYWKSFKEGAKTAGAELAEMGLLGPIRPVLKFSTEKMRREERDLAGQQGEIGRLGRYGDAQEAEFATRGQTGPERVAVLKELVNASRAYLDVANQGAQIELRSLQIAERLAAVERARWQAAADASEKALAAEKLMRDEAEKRAAAIYKADMADIQRKSDLYTGSRDRLRGEVDTFGQSAGEKEAYRLRKAGVDEGLVQEILKLSRSLEALTAQEQRAMQQRDREMQLRSKGDSLRQSLQTPAENLSEELREILQLRQAGEISRQTQLGGYRAALDRHQVNRVQTVDTRIGAYESYGRSRAPGQDRESRLERQQRAQQKVQINIRDEVKGLRKTMEEVLGKDEAVRLVYGSLN